MTIRAGLPHQDNEAEQVRLARERDPGVWAAWHDAYYPLVYRYAYARLANREDAEDVSSQVFLEAIKSIARFQYQGQPVVAWLYGIARHLISRRYRERAHSTRFENDASLELHEKESEEEATLNRVTLASMMEHLKDEHREVLILRYMLDLPSREVARLLGKTEQATYSLQVRALLAARKAATVETRSAA